MTGPEHYREAERLVSDALVERLSDPALVAEMSAKAQVHATLALAAATALSHVDPGIEDPIAHSWWQVAS